MKNRFPDGTYSHRFSGYDFVGKTIMQIKAILLLMVVAFAWIVPAQAKEEIDFGYTLAGIGDVNGDAVPDIAVGAPTHGQVVAFSGADGTLLYTLNAPDPQEQADFGHWLAGVEDVNGDAVPDIAVGAPTHGRVVVFSGADGALLSTLKSPESHAETVFGTVSAPLPGLGRVGGDAVMEDVNGDAVSDIAVEDPSHGQVLIFSGADGSLLHTLELPGQQAAADTRVHRTQEQALASICVARTKYVQAGDWRTLESFWNASGTAYFLHPAGAQIKVRYGVGWFGFDRQKQTLDGINTKTLSVGGGSIGRARMQMKVTQSVWVNYSVCV